MRTLNILPLLLLLASVPGLAAPMPVTQARELLGKKAFDEVYLAYSALEPGEHPDGDEAVAGVLLKAAGQALGADDPSLALGLSDTARKLAPKSVEACLVNADAAVVLKQRAAAEAALQRALELAPRNWEVVFRRADYAEQEGQLDKAKTLFQRIPRSHARGSEARKRADALKATLTERASDLERLKAAEAELARKQAAAARTAGTTTTAAAPPPVATGGSSAPDDVPAGVAARTSDHFRILYQGGSRGFADRARYEQRVLDTFEKSYSKVRSLLGRTTNGPTDVVLYTEEEFRYHFSAMHKSGVVGFYQAGKIRMNRSERINQGFYATAVHEFIHAVVDDVNGPGNVPTWVNEGLARWVERRVAGGDFINRGELKLLQSLSAKKQLPTLAQLSGSFMQMGPLTGAAYAKSSAAVEALTSTGGLQKLVRVIEAVGDGTHFDKAFAYEFGETRLGRLDGEVESLIDR